MLASFEFHNNHLNANDKCHWLSLIIISIDVMIRWRKYDMTMIIALSYDNLSHLSGIG